MSDNPWEKNLAQAKEYAEYAQTAEKEGDWADALAAWDFAFQLSLGSDFRDFCWAQCLRVQALIQTPRRRIEQDAALVATLPEA